MTAFRLQRFGMLMEPEPGNPQEVEGVLNPGAARGPMANSTSFRGWSRKEITRASALRGCGSMQTETRQASRGLALRSSRKPTMSGARTAAAVARILVSPSSNRFSATS